MSGGRTSHKMERVVIFIDCLIYLWELSPYHPLDGHGPQSQAGLLENREIFCPSQEVTSVQPTVNLKISHFPKDHLRLAVR